LVERSDYKVAGPQSFLQAFLQRITQLTGAKDAPSASTAWAKTNRSAADLENPSNVCGVQRALLELRVECASEILI